MLGCVLLVACASAPPPVASPATESAAVTPVPTPALSFAPPAEPVVALDSVAKGEWTMPPDGVWDRYIQHYTTGISPGQKLPIGWAGLGIRPFAEYLSAIHNRVHPWFADRFIGSLDKLPATDPLKRGDLVVRIELAIAPDGSIARIGVVKSSGLPAFDASGLEAFARAAPMPPSPASIRSTDGNVWVQWDLHRDDVYACSTMNAHPFRLATDHPVAL